jgi:fatty acid desaturase
MVQRTDLSKFDDSGMQSRINEAIAPFAHKPELGRSLMFLARDFLFLAVTVWAFAAIEPFVPLLLWYPVYSAMAGTVATGLWVLGHECGHGAFAPTRKQNNIVGFVIHSLLLVPYYSWQYSHGKHHKYTNHLVLGETHVPPTRKGAGPLRKIHSALGDAFPLFVIMIDLGFGWPAYLLGNATGGRTQSDLKSRLDKKKGKSHFLPSSQVMPPSLAQSVQMSLFGCIATLAALWAASFGWGVRSGFFYTGPYLVVNMWLVGYTWLQHTHPEVPHYGSDSFSFLKGALGTVDRPYPFIVDQLHHHIGSTHVLHHINHRIPHYRAEAATKAIRKVLGDMYNYDPRPITQAAWETAKTCVFVEGLEGVQYFVKPSDFSKAPIAKKDQGVDCAVPKEPVATARKRA